ncbi:MAG TPA: hypothetical protein VE684_13735, partial [Crenalkalicoccus sp.]|nr:hypothetical protein [Crenalkalicoccus sp.]
MAVGVIARLTIGQKLLGSAALASLVTLGLAVDSYANLERIGTALDRAERSAAVALAADTATRQLSAMRHAALSSRLTQDEAALREQGGRLDAAMQALLAALDGAISASRIEENQRDLQRARAAAERYHAAMREIMALRGEHLRGRATLMFNEGPRLSKELNALIALPELAEAPRGEELRERLRETDLALTDRRTSGFRYLAAEEPEQVARGAAAGQR